MEEVEELKEEVSRLKSQLQREITKVQKKEIELDKMKRQFQIEKEERLKKEVSESLEQIKDDLKKEKIKNVFASNDSRQKISVDFPEVIKYSSSSEGENNFEDSDEFCKAFPPGSVVFVTNLNQDGIVQGQANSKGEIPILSGSMRLMVPWEQLKPPKKTQNPLKKKANTSNTQISYDIRNDEIDIRGLTLSEAIEKLEVVLDSAQVKNIERVKIIHGHGSDALKKAVRSHLSRSVYVSRWQVAPTNEGGDGATWAFLMGDNS